MATSVSHRLNSYANMRTLPALFGVGFIVASLYQFGGLTEVQLEWISYSLTTEHAALASVAIFAAAFMSSETTDFERYERWEQVAVAAGPIVILGVQYVQQIEDLLLQLGDPLGYQAAFVVTLVSWGVAVGK